MRVAVYVRPKAGILDPQGEAVRRSLAELDFAVKDVRVGRLVDLDVDAQTAEEARTAAARMCERLLANPLIESYEIEVAPRPARAGGGPPVTVTAPAGAGQRPPAPR